MPSCAVKWCRSHTDMKNAGITFHIFPKNEVLRKKWVTAVRLERKELDWMPSECTKLCSIHFRSDDIYLCKNGKLNRLKKTAVPVCTMVSSNAGPFSNLSESPSIKHEANIDEQMTRSSAEPSSNLCGSSFIKLETNLDVQDEYSNEVNLYDTDGKTLMWIIEEPVCKNSEEKKLKMIKCPNCKYDLYIQSEIENEARLPSSEELQPSCSPVISVSSSEIESVFDSPRRQQLKKQLTVKTALSKKRLLTIKNLQRQNKRLKNKNLKLKEKIANLKK